MKLPLYPPVHRFIEEMALHKGVYPLDLYGPGGTPRYYNPCYNRRTGQRNPYKLTGGQNPYEDQRWLDWNEQCEQENENAPPWSSNPGPSTQISIPANTYGTPMSILMHERNCVDNFRGCYWDMRTNSCVRGLSGPKCQEFYNSLIPNFY